MIDLFLIALDNRLIESEKSGHPSRRTCLTSLLAFNKFNSIHLKEHNTLAIIMRCLHDISICWFSCNVFHHHPRISTLFSCIWEKCAWIIKKYTWISFKKIKHSRLSLIFASFVIDFYDYPTFIIKSYLVTSVCVQPFWIIKKIREDVQIYAFLYFAMLGNSCMV